MSFRPTISIYAEGRIVDIGYYRNWDEESLLYEAVALAILYHGCRTIEEFRAMCPPDEYRAGRSEEEEREFLEEFESCSELPIAVDLTRRCICCGGGRSDDMLRALPEAGMRDITRGGDFYRLLRERKISFDRLDFPALRKLMTGYSAILGRLSKETAGRLIADRRAGARRPTG